MFWPESLPLEWDLTEKEHLRLDVSKVFRGLD